MIINGKQIAEEILQEVANKIKKMQKMPTLCVLVMGNDPATESFISIKRRRAEEVGIMFYEVCMDDGLDTQDVVWAVKEASKKYDGIIVQFPLLPHIDGNQVRNAIPKDKDVDVLSDSAYSAWEKEESIAVPPVVGAMQEIVRRKGITLKGKKAVVVGRGWLVGVPTGAWLKKEGAEVTVLDSESKDKETAFKNADILVLGAGKPALITPDMIKDGVIILDAGTSEASGTLRGDAHPECAKKASVFTPVPGGIGPITVAIIFRNLVGVAKYQVL
jgi:methylenetetrahydrofolate dehydrogenase (NADP+) / methenyltetrahydrofolate cyclohydrolase